MANLIFSRWGRLIYSALAMVAMHRSVNQVHAFSSMASSTARKLGQRYHGKIPVAFASTRAVRSIPPISTRLMSTLQEETKQVTPPPFPRWIRLKAFADFVNRQNLTTEVADAIDASGGFISQTNLLSDMVTVFVLEDVCPSKLEAFQKRLDAIVTLDGASIQSLQECYDIMHHKEARVPDATMAVLQVNWKNAPGKLCHEIPMDG